LNEVSPNSLQGLQLGIAQLSPADQAKIAVIPGKAGAAHLAAAGAQIVIADPPRKGLDLKLVDHLGGDPPDRFIYISCSLESFLRDTVQLTSGGKLRLVRLTVFDLMPFTEHVELVAGFERR
jgi:23S rRNA (uracil1939-C5)-methyltransferase